MSGDKRGAREDEGERAWSWDGINDAINGDGYEEEVHDQHNDRHGGRSPAPAQSVTVAKRSVDFRKRVFKAIANFMERGGGHMPRTDELVTSMNQSLQEALDYAQVKLCTPFLLFFANSIFALLSAPSCLSLRPYRLPPGCLVCLILLYIADLKNMCMLIPQTKEPNASKHLIAIRKVCDVGLQGD